MKNLLMVKKKGLIKIKITELLKTIDFKCPNCHAAAINGKCVNNYTFCSIRIKEMLVKQGDIFINKKNNNKYTIIATAVCCDNNCDSNKMYGCNERIIIYAEVKDKSILYARHEKEFFEKFKIDE